MKDFKIDFRIENFKEPLKLEVGEPQALDPDGKYLERYLERRRKEAEEMKEWLEKMKAK